jgi:hypothetical protein
MRATKCQSRSKRGRRPYAHHAGGVCGEWREFAERQQPDGCCTAGGAGGEEVRRSGRQAGGGIVSSAIGPSSYAEDCKTAD